jgi:hypothetical protein
VAGGAVLAIYTFSVWPRMIKLMISSSGIATLTLTFFVYIVYMLAAIWVVAYNFVPIGGTVAREQTGPLMAVVLVGVGLPLFLHQKSEESDKKGNNKDNGQDAMKKKMFPHGMKTVLVLLVAIGLMGMGNRYYHKHYTNTKSDHPRDFTAMIWTIHFAYDNNGWPSFERIASLINNTGRSTSIPLNTSIHCLIQKLMSLDCWKLMPHVHSFITMILQCGWKNGWGYMLTLVLQQGTIHGDQCCCQSIRLSSQNIICFHLQKVNWPQLLVQLSTLGEMKSIFLLFIWEMMWMI